MEKEQIVKPIIYELVSQLKNKQITTNSQQESFLEREILAKLGPFAGQTEKMIVEIKEALVDPELSTPYKLPVLMYASLLCAKNDDGSQLLSFYYEFTSKALKDLKRNSKEKDEFWENLFEKIYQFGILLLAGNRTLLLSMEIFATRVNSQALAAVARQTKIGKLIRTYNCILCVPEKYITLKQILSLTLIFSRWEQPEDDPFCPSFFASFQKRTQKKLINKLSKYPKVQFTQEILLNLIKIILCGEELLFSYFLQAKFLYQSSKKQAFAEKAQSALDGLRKARVLKEGKRLFNLVTTLLLEAPEEVLRPLERQSILYIALKSLSGKFEDNEALFRILVTRFLSERNEIISHIAFRLIREEALTYLTVHKLKLLLNVFNLSSWKKIANDYTTQNLLTNRMQRVIELLKALARRYSDEDLNVRCLTDKCGISIQDVREVKSIVFVVVFEAVGKITEPSSIDCCLLKLRLDKGDLFQVIVSFPESTDSLTLVPRKQAKERNAIILIRQGKKELLREKKQYLRFGQGNFESIVTASLIGKDCRTLQISIDGAFYDFDLNRKSQIKGFEIGYLMGTIRSFYALNCQLEAIEFYKKWCERERKLHYVVEQFGIDKYCYKLNRYQEPPILQFQEQGWSWFHSKTQIVLHQTFKHPKVLDSYLQLGGLETILFVLERLSRCLQDFKGNEQKIVYLLKQFFEMLKLTAYLDETHSFIKNIIKCYKFINPFLFLLIKRNHFIRESHDSQLLLSIFELLQYFRKFKHQITFKPEVEERMKRIEKKLVVSTLANFEIWSNCSTNLQQFVLSLIDQFIRNGKEIQELIRLDLHKQLLSSVVLFATSETELPFSETLQKGLTEVCLSLYSTILKYYGSTSQIKELCLKKIAEDNFIERDLNLTIALLQSLSHRALGRALSISQTNGFEAIIRYLKKCFLGSDILFSNVGKLWESILWAMCNIASSEGYLQSKLICSLSGVILSYVSRENNQDQWIILFINAYLNNKVSTFLDCLKIINYLADRYNFITPGKSVILETIIETLTSKLTQDDSRKGSIQDLASITYALTAKAFYRLSSQKSFLKFLLQLKQKFLRQGSDSQVWRSINKHLMMVLFKEAKITQANAPVVNFLLANIYDKDQKHPLATTNFHFSSQNILRIKELAKCHKSIQNNLKQPEHLGAYPLIDHCRGWLTAYFLLDEGLLTGEDAPIPFASKDLPDKECVCGTIAYYLSGYCGPLELYLLLNIILYRQLGNRITFLSTLAPVSIYQKALEYLMNNSTSLQEFSGGNHLLVLLLNQTVNSLNRGYIIKAGSITKEIQRMLGPPGSELKKKKDMNLLDVLSRASKAVQMAFEDSRVDKEMIAFLQLVLSKLHLMAQQQGNQMKIFMTLAQQMKKCKQTLQKKISLMSSRFFEVARQQWIAQDLIQISPQPRAEKLKQINLAQTQKFERYIEQLNQRYQRVLYEINERGIAGERQWKQLLESNEHWFELQGSLDDLSSCFYELDEKQVGPFGFYKLNIRPVRTELNKLPYPRRQEYKDLILQKQVEQRNRQLYDPDKFMISKETSTFFDSITEGTREQLIKSIARQTPHRQQPPNETKNAQKKTYWCEWITKRGAYAGKLTKKENALEFSFTGHQQMPNEPVYQISTNRCHWRENLSEWQKEQVSLAIIPFARSQIFTRRYILRHTAFELFSEKTHTSYFFNLFHQTSRNNFLEELKYEKDADLIVNRKEQFTKKGFTQQWRKGELSNFEYLCLLNRYSGRSTNDLAQYPVMPWVVTNFDGKQNYSELNKDYLKNERNLRDLSLPAGKLSAQKFNKLKMRLLEIDPSDIQIRFLYGTMYSNPTILYNFFIRLEPFTSLHWEHQGRKIDHADRLFSGINQQFATVLSSSSDNKQLTPEFYYWPEFLRNRNQIELGRKQKGEEVHSVVLPVWARSPEEFIFKMREALESQQVSQKLHLWIDLIFGCKAPYQFAEEHDNLYHYQCYQHDIFTSYSNQNEIKTAQIAISEFGQVPEVLFTQQHPKRDVRRHINIDQVISIFKPQKDLQLTHFQHNDAGIILWNDSQIIFKKAAIPGLYTNFEAARTYESQGACYLLSINLNRWISISNGLARVYEKRKVKWQHLLDSKCLQVLQDYVIYGCGSRIEIIKMVGDYFETVKSLFGHHSDVIIIRTQPFLDLILSIDKSGLVLIHELSELRFFKAFQLGVQFSSADVSKIKVCIHQMGYYIILDHQQTLYVYNFLGELLLEQELEPRVAEYRNDEETITDIQLMSHDQPIILASSSKGNIYSLNFLDIINFKEIYPFKSFSRMNTNLLAGIKKRPSNSIVKFAMIHSRATSNIIHQIIVLYSDGEVVCFSESNQMGKQLQSNERLKSMGFV